MKEKLITAGDILKIKEEFKNASELKEKKIKEDFENAYANMMIRFNEIHATSVRNLESRHDGLYQEFELLKKKSENGLKPKVVAVEKQIPLDDKSRGGLNLSLNEKISAIVIGIIVLILLWFIL